MIRRIDQRGSAGFLALSATVCLLASVGVARGDRVFLRNGEVLEGIITSRTDESVSLDIGMGTVSVARSRIDRIEQEGEEANRSRRNHWRATYIDPSELPENVQELARHWERLKRHRAEALQAVQTGSRLDRERARLERTLRDVRKQYLAVNRRLGTMSADKDRKTYNAVVTENNRLAAAVNNTQARLQESESRREASRKAVPRYARTLTAFQIAHREFTAAYAAGDPEDLANLWLGQAGEEMAAFDADFERMTVPVNNTPGGRIARATVNDDVTGSFLIDTGASVVTVSAAMARRLRLTYDPKKPVAMRLADGEITDAFPVWLASLQVGDARAENIRAVVLPEAPSPDVDGLLGMTFLSRFQMSFDGQDGEMVLRKLRTN